MLAYQKKKLSEKYARHILKLDPFLLNISGCIQQETRLKIGTHMLHCTPATFSFTNCQLLIFLASNEIEYFKKFEKNLISLSFAFGEAYFGNPVSFYLKGRFESLKEMREGIYVLDFKLTSLSDSYKEIFLYLSEISTIYDKLYNSVVTEEQLVGLSKVPFKNAKIVKDGALLGIGNLENIKLDSLDIKLAESNIILEQENIYILHIAFNNNMIKLVCEVKDSNDNIYNMSVKYNSEYIHILSRYMNMGQKTDTNDEVDELEEI